MRTNGNGRPNSGTHARASDLAGEAAESRIQVLHGHGSGRVAHAQKLTGRAGVMQRQPKGKGAGRLARTID
jgi:hypothetical protein